MSRRFPVQALWLLSLWPGNAVVLLDLQQGVVRPVTWLARFAPALAVLGLVLWAHLRASPLALRLRAELRLALGPGLLLLISSGAALTLDALPAGGVHGIVRTLPWVMAVVLPAAAALTPMSLEREHGTLWQLLTTPVGARAFAEKSALAAGLVVLSWLQLSGGEQRGTELWWFALSGHVLALATVPTWFFLTQGDETTLGFVVLTPFVVMAPAGLLLPAAILPCVVLYGVAMLALLSAAVRRGVAVGAPAWLREEAPGLWWLERWARPLLRAELRGQRDAIILGGAGLLVFAVLRLLQVTNLDDAEAAPMALFVFCGLAAVLSPSLAFTEARRLGTLDAQLAVQPRRRVFVSRALVSAATTVVVSVSAPVALLAASSGLSLQSAANWVLAMTVLWAIGLVVAVHLGSVGAALVAGVGLAFGLVLSHAALLFLCLWGVAVLLDASDFPAVGAFLAAAMGVIAATAVGVAWRRFITSDRLEPRVLLSATAVSLGHAAVLGAASVVAATL